MSQSEITDVVAAVEAMVRRAYTLGRRDALRNLVKYAQSDEAVAKPLALLAPMAEASAFLDEGTPRQRQTMPARRSWPRMRAWPRPTRRPPAMCRRRPRAGSVR